MMNMKRMDDTQNNEMLVEFYDRECLENVVSLLHRDYPAVTFVYFLNANEPTQEERKRLSRFVQKKFGIRAQFLEIQENTIDSAAEQFRGLLARCGSCDFDITGGSSVFIAAVGVLLAEAGRKRVSIHEYDVAAGRCVFCSTGETGAAAREEHRVLTVSETLALRGVQVLNRGEPLRYDLNGDLRGEIRRLWEAVRGDLRAWNAFSVRPAKSTSTWLGLRVEKQMTKKQYDTMTPMLERLTRAQIFSDVERRDRGNDVYISYCLNVPEEAHVLYQKGGNLLELLTYLAAKDSGRFADCCTGIKLDWDNRDENGDIDPFNELDVVMTGGYIPYFVSCKNTAIENEYLYEIMTMTRHFGGRYAVPVVASTVKNGDVLRARAREMGITLIDGISEMTCEQFTEVLAALPDRK